jgi:hypothetical protein
VIHGVAVGGFFFLYSSILRLLDLPEAFELLAAALWQPQRTLNGHLRRHLGNRGGRPAAGERAERILATQGGMNSHEAVQGCTRSRAMTEALPVKEIGPAVEFYKTVLRFSVG